MPPELIAGTLSRTVGDTPPGPPPRPRLRANERRPDPDRWRDVLPPTLAEQVADTAELEAHRALVARVEAATVKARKLDAAHAAALEADRAAEVGFAAGKARTLPPPAGPDAEAAAAQARRELELLERELPASGNALFAAAYPHLDDALRELERQLDADDERVEASIMEALRALDERATVAGEAHWVGLAMWESSLVPYGSTRATASAPVAAELRQTLAGLRHEREDARRKRLERMIELEMNFNADRSPKRPDGRPLNVRRAEAEQRVRAREGAA